MEIAFGLLQNARRTKAVGVIIRVKRRKIAALATALDTIPETVEIAVRKFLVNRLIAARIV